MSGRYVYPRIPSTVTEFSMRKLLEETGGDLARVADEVGYEHPLAAPVATGGPVVPADHLREVRAAVLDELAWALPGERMTVTPDRKMTLAEARVYDRELGRVLHEQLDILASDAAHAGPWSFLSFVVLPDVVIRRWPDPHVDRFVGTDRNRNALRRVWVRHDILGALMLCDERPLGEDELTALLERTDVARNRRLVRVVAEHILGLDTPRRSNHVRELMKLVRRRTSLQLLDLMDDSALTELVAELSERVGATELVDA